ncbi:MAG: RNA polymerase sigma factor, partial [Agathobacter sp.]
KITRRVAIDMVRRHNRNKRVPSEYTTSLTELEECLSNGNTAETKLEEGLLATAINQYLRTIPEENRNLFIGRYFFLDSLKDAAKYCGMSEAKAKTVLYRTRLGLKEYLEKEGFYL